MVLTAKTGEEKKLNKEKKKKIRRLEVSQANASVDIPKETTNVMGSVEIDYGVKQKKEKKRYELPTDIAPQHVQSEATNVLGVLEIDTGVKKIKKKMSCESDNDIASVDVRSKMTNVTDHEEVNTGVKKMNKKKKKKKRNHELADNIAYLDVLELCNSIASENDPIETTDGKALGSAEVATVLKKKKKILEVSSGIASVVMRSEATSMMVSGSVKADTGAKKKKIHGPSNDITSENTPGSAIIDAGVRKKKKRQEVFNDIMSEEGNSHSQKHGLVSSLKDDAEKMKIRRNKDNLKTAKNVSGGFVSDDRNNRPSVSIGIIVEKNDDREMKGKKKKIKMAKNILEGSVGEDNCEANEKASVLKTYEKEGSKKVKSDTKDTEATDSSKESKSKRKGVSFSDYVEVFPLPEHLKYRKLNSEGGLVRGKRYTPEEDAKLLQAVDDYIVKYGLAADGVDKGQDENWARARVMIMNCKEHSKEHPELKGCWKDITAAIPWRTHESVYDRAHILYERAEVRKWNREEIDMILSFHEQHGPKWRELGDLLGKSRKHIKDAYRRNKLRGEEKKGTWSQEEYQKFFELVNDDICIKAVQEKKVKYGMLRDNIAWEAISESLKTRATPTCCHKWYNQICSSMVREGKWSDTDDYRLVDALFNQDACCIEDVEWDSLLEHRPGDLCHNRWAEMARNLGEHRVKPFLEQVEVLRRRYKQAVIEAREIYEKKDPVDV